MTAQDQIIEALRKAMEKAVADGILKRPLFCVTGSACYEPQVPVRLLPTLIPRAWSDSNRRDGSRQQPAAYDSAKGLGAPEKARSFYKRPVSSDRGQKAG